MRRLWSAIVGRGRRTPSVKSDHLVAFTVRGDANDLRRELKRLHRAIARDGRRRS